MGGTNICFRIDSHKIPVRSITMGGIQVGDGEVSFPDNVVVCKHDSCDTRQEDGIAIIRLWATHWIPGQIWCEIGGAVQYFPRTHDETDSGCDISSTSNIDIPWHQRRQIVARGHRVSSNVYTELRQRKRKSDEKCSRASRRVWIIIKKIVQQIKWILQSVTVTVRYTQIGCP